MIAFYTLNAFLDFAFMEEAADSAGIALVHTGFNVLATLVLLPFANLLEKLSLILIQPDEEEERQDKILEILSECEKAGNPDMAYEFASTSKISFSGAGVAAIAASKGNLECIRKTLTIQTIGYDKINQLRHVRYFKDFEGIKAHMRNMPL